MKLFRSLLCAAGIIVIGLASCSKSSTGSTGPAGPAGPDSVFSSQWINMALVYNPADSAYEEAINAPSITQSILDSGVVLSYVNFEESNGTYHVTPTGALVPFIFEDFSVGQINLSAGANYNFPYRYVTIPGALVTGNGANRKVKGYTPTELKAMSFEQVQQVLSNKN